MQISLPLDQSSLEHAGAPADRPALWNPRAATCWGLLLSPAFSAYVHMRNWEALGDLEKVRETRAWFYLLCAYFTLCCTLTVASELLGRDLAPPLLATPVLLAGWHARTGRGQERYVAVLTGNAYARRPWAGILLAGAGAWMGVAALGAGLMFSVAP